MKTITFNGVKYPISDAVIFNGKTFPTRSFTVKPEEEDDEIQMTIAPLSLSKLLINQETGQPINDDAKIIDDDIYFFVDDEFFNLPEEELCHNHLDEKYELVLEDEED